MGTTPKDNPEPKTHPAEPTRNHKRSLPNPGPHQWAGTAKDTAGRREEQQPRTHGEPPRTLQGWPLTMPQPPEPTGIHPLRARSHQDFIGNPRNHGDPPAGISNTSRPPATTPGPNGDPPTLQNNSLPIPSRYTEPAHPCLPQRAITGTPSSHPPNPSALVDAAATADYTGCRCRPMAADPAKPCSRIAPEPIRPST